MMNAPAQRPTARLAPLVLAWAGLVALTLVSLGLGAWLKGASWLPLLVAAIIWLKAWLVAIYFLEARLSNTFIRRLIWVFIAFAPIALVLTDAFGRQFADLVQL
jgi:hypothetical protein